VSVHGANRLGTNSLLDIVVFGKRSGAAAAEDAMRAPASGAAEAPEADTVALLRSILESNGDQRVVDIRTELQDNMFDKAGVIRTDRSLRGMREIIGDLRERAQRVAIHDKGKVFNSDLMEAVELHFLLDCAENLVVAALARTESRGGHWRDDYPVRDDENWLKHTLSYRQPDGSIKLEFKPVKMGPYVPMERKY
jgi:succinate dehydrogenase / fumarate reductase flavoprotein subunit